VSRKGSGAWAKWERAKRHLKTLGDELGASPQNPYGWSKRYRATAEAHRNGLEYRFYVDAVELDTADWPLLVGDCLFNLRSALDHIVFSLHVKACRGDVPREVAEKSAFPILDQRAISRRGTTDTAKWTEIKRLPYTQRRALAWLQPYNRRNDDLKNIRRSLDRIGTLNNIDKHRHLHVLQAAPQIAGVAWFGDPPGYGFRHESFFGRPLVGKTEVFRWTFTTAPPDIANYLHSDGDVRAFVCLNEGGETTILLPLFRQLVADVGTVLKRFAVFL
jgi:hypothetical protein